MGALVLAFLMAFAQGAMDDASADAKAKSIWGTFAMIAQSRQYGDTYWLKQVGCVDPGTRAFIVAGAALNTWDAAFATVDQKLNGPITDGSSSPNGAWLCNPMPLTVISPADLPGGNVGVIYKITLIASGGLWPYTWSLPDGSVLPPGLALQTSGIVGVPTTAGTYKFTVKVSTTSDAPNNIPSTSTTADLTITIGEN